MGYHAKIILDSIAPNGIRLTTMELRYPRIVHAEMLRHRVYSRSVASSRAIPVLKQIEKIKNDPFIPERWQANQKGMVAGDELSAGDSAKARKIWLEALAYAEKKTLQLVELNVHKEIANRLMEVFSYTVELVTGTEWDNFYDLRVASPAQPQIEKIAHMARDAQQASTPTQLARGEWHMPMLRQEDLHLSLEDRKAISAGRCARLSYETHYGVRDTSADIALQADLIREKHWSPMEHQATPAKSGDDWSGNFRGWVQNRKILEVAALQPKKSD